MTKFTRLITGYLGAIMFVPGFVKFFEPFKTMFSVQIAKSGLPFPEMSYWYGQLGELSTGLTMLVLFLFWDKISPAVTDKMFYISHLLVTIIMVVAVYVHLHPDVPAEVLPMEKKPPFLAVFTLIMVGLNIYLHKRTSKSDRDLQTL